VRTKHILDELKQIREHSEMKKASFTRPGYSVFSKENEKFTQEVREGTRNWRNTWIIAPLDEIIDMLEAEVSKNGRSVSR